MQPSLSSGRACVVPPATRRPAGRAEKGRAPLQTPRAARSTRRRGTVVGADGGLGSASVCEDRRPGRSRGALTDALGQLGHRSRSCCRATGRSPSTERERAPDAAGAGRSAPAGRVLRTPSVGSRHARARRRARALRPRRALRRRRTAITPTTRSASPCSAAPRSSIARAARRAAVGHPRARLAGRPRAGVPEDALSSTIRSSAACRPCSRSTTSRFRASSRRRRCRRSAWAGSCSTSQGARVLGTASAT